MATQAYWNWVNLGRQYELAKPVAILYEMARAAGVRRHGSLGSDDEAHLQSDFPEDHTPFSYTAWPKPLPGYVVCAVDIANGPWMQRLLDDAKSGRAPWVKYLNFGGRHYNVTNGWAPVPSGDEHGHISCRTDYLTYTNVKNPFIEENDVNLSDTVPGTATKDYPKDRTVAQILADVARWHTLFYGTEGVLRGYENRLIGKLVTQIQAPAPAPVQVDGADVAAALAANHAFLDALAATVVDEIVNRLTNRDG